MIRVTVGADDGIDIFNAQVELCQPPLHMLEEPPVARIDQDPTFAINEKGVAVVGGHGLPDKGMQIVG
jgi:hypothetical protein